MNILFLTLLDFENLRQSNIYTDLINEFQANHHKVCVVSPVERKKKRQTEVVTDGDCKILKLKIGNIQKTNMLEKGLSTIMIEHQIIGGIKKHFSDVRFDLIIYATPPVTFEKVIAYVKGRDHAKSYLLLKDIFPQNAVDLELIKKNSLIHRFFKRKEKKLYQVSDYIGTMSEGNRQYLLEHNAFLPVGKVEINPNTVAIKNLKMPSKTATNKFRKQHNISKNAIILMYGGNLGKPQGLDFLLQIVDQLANSTEYFFVVAGSGTEAYKISEFIKARDINNFLFLEELCKTDYEEIESQVDVGMIFLDERFTIPNIPSRMLGYMKAGLPIIAATDVNTDLKSILEQGDFGLWCRSGDYKAFQKNLLKIRNYDLRKKMGENSFGYLHENYDVSMSYETIIKHIFES